MLNNLALRHARATIIANNAENERKRKRGFGEKRKRKKEKEKEKKKKEGIPERGKCLTTSH